jgi:hypothetical protein
VIWEGRVGEVEPLDRKVHLLAFRDRFRLTRWILMNLDVYRLRRGVLVLPALRPGFDPFRYRVPLLVFRLPGYCQLQIMHMIFNLPSECCDCWWAARVRDSICNDESLGNVWTWVSSWVAFWVACDQASYPCVISFLLFDTGPLRVAYRFMFSKSCLKTPLTRKRIRTSPHDNHIIGLV